MSNATVDDVDACANKLNDACAHLGHFPRPQEAQRAPFGVSLMSPLREDVKAGRRQASCHGSPVNDSRIHETQRHDTRSQRSLSRDDRARPAHTD